MEQGKLFSTLKLHPGRDHSLEVVVKLEEVEDASASDADRDASEPEEKYFDSSGFEPLQPKMKIFPGRTAPGLRIRSAPTYMVSLMLIASLCYS